MDASARHGRPRPRAAAVGTVVLVVLGIGIAIGVARFGGGEDPVGVGETGHKEVVDSFDPRDIDAFVVVERDADALIAVRRALDAHDAVERYGFVAPVYGSVSTDAEHRELACRGAVAAVALTEGPAFEGLAEDLAGAGATDVRRFEQFRTADGDPIDGEIFMSVDANDAQLDRVLAMLDGDPLVARYRHVTKDDAYEEFREIFADDPELADTTSPELLPASFQVVLVDGTDGLDVLARYEGVPGVETVLTPEPLQHDPVIDAPATPRPTPTEIFMTVDATDGEIAAVRDALAADPDARGVDFLDHEAAYEVFRRRFADRREVVAATRPEHLPVSFRVQLGDAVDPDTFAARYENLPGVESVFSPTDHCR